MRQKTSIVFIVFWIAFGILLSNLPGMVQTYRAGVKAQADHKQFLEELERSFTVGSN